MAAINASQLVKYTLIGEWVGLGPRAGCYGHLVDA